MDARFDLHARWLHSYNEAIFFLFQATLLCNDSWVHPGSLRQHGQENYTLQLSMSIAIVSTSTAAYQLLIIITELMHTP